MDKFDLDYGQEDLFGSRTIPSIGFNEQQMIRDILYLHSKGNPIDCDPTYSVGNFYKDGLPQPIHRFDKYPQLENVIEASSNNLPLANSTCKVIMFDPPFVIGAANETAAKSDNGSCIIQKRFTGFKSFDELRTMYSSSLQEFYRILQLGGIVIFKCQDVVSGGKQYFSHCYTMAIKAGFYAKDLFVLLNKSRITDGRKQQHARKYHCYYWVFEKQK